MKKSSWLTVVILFVASFGFSDMIPSICVLSATKDKQKNLNVMNVKTSRRTEKTGVKGQDRTIVDLYTVTFPKACKKCKILHVVKGLGDYATKVNGSSTFRPTFTSRSSIQTRVEKDSTVYLFSTDEREATQEIKLRPMKEEQSYEYSSVSTGKGAGRPTREGYTHKGFIIYVTWGNDIEQVFSDIPELRNKTNQGNTDYITEYISNLVTVEKDQ